jgi:hypothetical protein
MIGMTGENLGRICTVFFVVFTSVSLLHSQSLAEAAKKEKERRAALQAKGIKSVVVTNADLNKQRSLLMLAVQSQNISSQGRTQETQRTAPRPASQTTPRQKSPDANQNRDVYGYRKNATKVIFSSEFIKNPDFALNRPDGKYAEISILGVLELEFEATNESGADIAIYARLAGSKEVLPGGAEAEGVPIDSLELDYQEGFWYGVLVMAENGEWEAVGKGLGRESPEEFDLGKLQSISKIRIMFKPHTNADLQVKFLRNHPGEFTFGIDAVEALH